MIRLFLHCSAASSEVRPTECLALPHLPYFSRWPAPTATHRLVASSIAAVYESAFGTKRTCHPRSAMSACDTRQTCE